MVRNEQLTAIIPVRGGSTTLPGKNLYRIEGETLLERAIRQCRESDRVDRVFVTTDDPEMYAIAEAHGVAPPNLRPAQLATPRARTIDAVMHLINDAGINGGYLLLMQVTTPLRTIEDLKDICECLELNVEAEAIVSVVRHDAPHPDKFMVIESGWLHSYLGTKPDVPRQNLPEVYVLNGAFYLASFEAVCREHSFLPKKCIPYVMPVERSINLDGPLDLLLLKSLLGEVET